MSLSSTHPAHQALPSTPYYSKDVVKIPKKYLDSKDNRQIRLYRTPQEVIRTLFDRELLKIDTMKLIGAERELLERLNEQRANKVPLIPLRNMEKSRQMWRNAFEKTFRGLRFISLKGSSVRGTQATGLYKHCRYRVEMQHYNVEFHCLLVDGQVPELEDGAYISECKVMPSNGPSVDLPQGVRDNRWSWPQSTASALPSSASTEGQVRESKGWMPSAPNAQAVHPSAVPSSGQWKAPPTSAPTSVVARAAGEKASLSTEDAADILLQLWAGSGSSPTPSGASPLPSPSLTTTATTATTATAITAAEPVAQLYKASAAASSSSSGRIALPAAAGTAPGSWPLSSFPHVYPASQPPPSARPGAAPGYPHAPPSHNNVYIKQEPGVFPQYAAPANTTGAGAGVAYAVQRAALQASGDSKGAAIKREVPADASESGNRAPKRVKEEPQGGNNVLDTLQLHEFPKGLMTGVSDQIALPIGRGGEDSESGSGATTNESSLEDPSLQG